ncbi:MAG: type I-C CRISPR-associated protein Cas8c/Csd1 [Gammaproteobacteria bacterium]|nr:type I-C CRISPR-associated protein Cas8c/Csd1 [Gammaproteobacteria bacterium]
MTVLQALARQHERLVRVGEAPSYGFSREPISYALVISLEGSVVDVAPLLDTSGRTPHPTPYDVPQRAKRTSGVASNFLWDKTAYVLGVKGDPDTKQRAPAPREHAAFRKLHADLLAETDDAALQALHRFLDQWTADSYAFLPNADGMLDQNIVFRLDGELSFIHKRPEAREIWIRHLSGQQGPEGLCLVTGSTGSLARVHARIKGVWGAKGQGADIVSFNKRAFESFGKEQGANAPISAQAAFAYATTLNALLATDSRRRIQIGDATTVFWAEATGGEDAANAAEELFAMLAEPPTATEEEATIADKLSAIGSGRPFADAVAGVDEQTRFHVLGLSPNAGRLSIRYWHTDTLGAIARRIVEHWRDMHIEPLPWRTPPAASRVLIETAPLDKNPKRRADRIPPIFGGTLMRAILTGSPYPRSLLATVIMRMRQDRDINGLHAINGLRAAICKACLARDYRLGLTTEDVPVSLNPNETNVAYRLGRLFAVYEKVQSAALGNVNATIKDRYFGAASATPASIFPLLERTSGHHLATLRKNEKAGLAHWFEREIDDILAGVDTALPRSLRLEEQGRFAIGYHHQRASRRRGSADETTDTHTDEGE